MKKPYITKKRLALEINEQVAGLKCQSPQQGLSLFLSDWLKAGNGRQHEIVTTLIASKP